MSDKQVAEKLTETWARAATTTSNHDRDYFIEAIREMQRRKDISAMNLPEQRSEKPAS